MYRICFVIPYFGPFPFWMEYFLESCRANSTVDFLLYTDNPKPEGLPSNIHYRLVSFQDYKRKVSKALGIEFDPDCAYKLCDIKPALGAVHRNELKGYDFWGFCDLDLIFGRVRHFFSDDLLSRYEIVSTHDNRVSGHCCILKNTPKYVFAFSKVRGWRKIFEDSSHFGFDEKRFSKLFVGLKSYPRMLRTALQYLFRPYSRKAYFVEQYSTPGLRYNWLDGSRDFPTRWFWCDGVLTNNVTDREFLYFHFLEWKKYWGGRPEHFTPPARNWVISKEGFESSS